MQETSSNPLRAWAGQEGRGTGLPSLSELGTHLLLPQTRPLQLRWSLDSDWCHQLPWFPGLQTLCVPGTRAFEWASQPTQRAGGKGLNLYRLEVSEHHLCPITGGPWTIQTQGRALGSQAAMDKIKMTRNSSSFALWEGHTRVAMADRDRLQFQSRTGTCLLKPKD